MSNPISPWGTKPRSNKGTPEGKSLGRGIFWLMWIIILSVGAAAFYYFLKPQGANVGLEFTTKPDPILLGDRLTLSISASNYSDIILKSSKLSIFLPDGVSFEGQSQSQRVRGETLGDLGPGSIGKRDFNLIVTNGVNSVKHLEAKLIYSTAENPNTQFERAENIDLLVGQPAVGINITSPQSVFSGQDFDIQVAYLNNTGHDFSNIHLKVDYPPVFQFKKSSVAAEDQGNNSWKLGNLPAASGGTITITGNIIGQEKSFFGFAGSVSADFSGVTYTINTQSVNLSISPAPLSLEIALSNGSDYIAHPGDTLNYTVNFKNNSDVTMQNINIKAKLIGEMFDFGKLQSSAAFNSLTNTASWSPATTPALMNLAPGQSGTLLFHIPVKSAFPIRFISDKNYTLKVQAQIESPTVPPNTTAERTISVASLENKVAGQIDLEAVAYWRDAASGILNNGPYPPKVNQLTQYTVHWKVTNYSTDVSNLVISAYLESGARFTGKVKSVSGSAPNYDPNSGFVSWNVGSVPATKGVVSAPLEAVFQIEVTPAINQVNQNITFLSESKAEGTDLFTGLPISVKAPQLDSSLPYDKTINVSDRAVKP